MTFERMILGRLGINGSTTKRMNLGRNVQTGQRPAGSDSTHGETARKTRAEMDLFSQVDDPQSDEELADWVNREGLNMPFPDEEPTDQPMTPLQKAFICGQEAAGVPNWSHSVRIIKKRLDAILERLAAEEQPAVVQAFEDGQAAYRERRAAEMAMDLEEIP